MFETPYNDLDEAIDAADDWLYSNTDHIMFDATREDLYKVVEELHDRIKDKELKKIDQVVENVARMCHAKIDFEIKYLKEDKE